MNTDFDLKMAYHMGYEDALAKRMPEPSKASVLGRGACQMEYVADWMGWHCKSCDNIRQGLRDQKPNYCPNCGRRVES